MKLCDNKLNWLRKYLKGNDAHQKNLIMSWHAVHGNNSPETDRVVQSLRDHGCLVTTFRDEGNFPDLDLKINGPAEYHLGRFSGLEEVDKYLAVIDEYL